MDSMALFLQLYSLTPELQAPEGQAVIFRTENYYVTGDHHNFGTIRRRKDDSEVVTLQGEEYADFYDTVDNMNEDLQDLYMEQYD